MRCIAHTASIATPPVILHLKSVACGITTQVFQLEMVMVQVHHQT